MIEIPFLPVELAFAGLWLVLRLIVWLRNRHIDWRREAVLLLIYVDLAVLVRFTLFPMELAGGRVQPLLFDPDILPLRVNLVPLVRLLDFLHYGSRREILLNIVGNVAMFIPTGIVLPIVYRRLDSLGKVLLAGAGLSLCIELLQLPFRARATDVDDLLLNTLGTILGYGLYAAVKWLLKRCRGWIQKEDPS